MDGERKEQKMTDEEYKASIQSKSTEELTRELLEWIDGYFFDLAEATVRELERRVEEAQLPAWIPVTERLPEHEYGESTSVLTVDLYGAMRVAYFDGGNWCLPSGEALTTMRVAPITHWMPLPEPPKGERKENG